MGSKKLISFFLAVCLSLPLFAQYKNMVRGNIAIPDLKDFVTLKCDFHIHTVFSDGVVWPTVRVDEAYREGLDAISITDHVEYRRWSPNVTGSLNRTYEIALPEAKANGIMLIKGAEISRPMPPGHFCALFLTNCDELEKPDYMDVFRAAGAQNAFIVWNHPGGIWQPDTVKWWPEHTKLLELGLLHGIEVVNTDEYFPEAHAWCLEKKLTMFGSLDPHLPLFFPPGKHRPLTLVFARNRTEEAIREALKARRTAVWFEELVIGEEKYLKELFENSVDIEVTKTNNSARITFTNKSDLTFHLKKTRDYDQRLVYFRDHTIVPQGKYTITVRFEGGIQGGDVNFTVENFYVQPNKGMRYTIKL